MIKSKEDKHVCHIASQEDPLVTYITEGYCVILRRKIRTYFMINPNSFYTRAYFKSSCIIEREKTNHLKHYYYMIHPFSKAKEHGDLCAIVILFFAIIVLKINVFKKSVINEDYLEVVCIFLLFLDIIRIFFTGVYRDENNQTVLNPKKVSRIYLKGWFTIDVMTLFPSFFTVRSHETKTDYFISFFAVLMQFARILKYLRLFNIMQKYNPVSVHLFRAARLLSMTVMIILWISTTIDLVVDVYPETWSENTDVDHFIVVTQRCFYIFFLFGIDGVPSKNLYVLIFETLLLHLGHCFYLYSSIQFIQIMNLHHASSNMNIFLESQIHLLADYKSLPHIIRNKMLYNFEFNLQKTYFNESFILETVSGQLKKELNEYYDKRFISRLNVFNVLPSSILSQIVKCMKMRVYFSQEIIYKTGMFTKFIYFMYVGTVAVYNKYGDEVGHLYDGDYFGELVDTTDTPTVFTIMAIEYCKIYLITFADLKKSLENYANVLNDIIKFAKIRRRLQNLHKGISTDAM